MSVALYMPDVKPGLRLFAPAVDSWERWYHHGYHVALMGGRPDPSPGDGSEDAAIAYLDGFDDGLNHRLDIQARCDTHTVADELWLLGETLGAEGELAELATPHADERDAFDAGLDWGDNDLWDRDPSWAAWVAKERTRLRASGSRLHAV